ncbi:hypothetical protein L210DRAFT_2364543 [Boletus edulis BED1]|uniref:Uncharacterized protein n=1 Tax=Boletus edulis BED1 TaxID=1328754 RepID=A0AAD4BR12_BOLED|nr:hypothetical protein L210DRAFT_2364543 [Boletus edulis BED1]
MSSLPLDKPSRFSLDTAGVTILLGGGDAVSAMTAVHVYGNRRWLGWYNTPGSFHIANYLTSFAKSASFHNMFGGKPSSKPLSRTVQMDPTSLLGLDRSKGPKFRAAHSGTIIEETGYVASLFMKECAAWDSDGKVVQGRRTQPIGITIADLGPAPPSELYPARSHVCTLLFASIPIAVSIGTCAVSAVYGDLYASSLILGGIVASGLFCFLLGSADLVFTHPEPAKGSPAGDGILGSDKEIVLLRGTEGAVNSITRGGFTLRFASECQYKLIRWCSLLFFAQSISQLFLIPQASLFGQVMFLASIGISALYNAWISSFDKEKIHRKLLFQSVLASPTLTKYTLGTRTTAVVFMLLVLQPQDPTKLLNELLPNDTRVWKQWKGTILERLHQPSDQAFQFAGKAGDLNGFAQEEKDLLKLLYEDARAAYNGYKDYCQVN